MNKVARYGGIKYNNNITKQPGYIYTSNTGMVIVNELYQVKQFYDVNHLPQSVVYIAGDGINITSNVITVKNDIARKSDLTSKADLIGGKVPSTQLPSYVDDVIQGYIDLANNKFYGDVNKQNEITAESGKIYIDLTSNLQYRFGGSVFVSISKSLALGQTAQTAFAGDRGKVIEQEMEGKLNKEEGKGLSTNDYTTEQKTKLSGIETNAEVNIIESITINGSTPTVSNKNQTFNIKSCSPIPSSVNTYGTTVQFCNDMINANKGNAQVGMMYMGTVHLKDVPLDMQLPNWSTLNKQCEILVKVVGNGILELTLTSTGYRQRCWISMYNNGNMQYGDTTCPWFAQLLSPVSGGYNTSSANERVLEKAYMAASQKYVDDAVGNINTILDNINGEVL